MDKTIILELAASATLMALSAFFSSSKTALFSRSQMQQEDPQEPTAPHIRETRYVRHSISVERLLADIRKGSGFTAVATEKPGGAEGLVMREDVLEVRVRS